jgi:hypothetical protein
MLRRGWLVSGVLLGLSSRANAAEPVAPKWYEALKLAAFVDTYAGFNFANPKPPPYVTANRYRAYDQHNGFGLHWAGADATVEPDPVGATVSLRFGPSAAIYTGSPDNELGLSNVKQAFVAYKPGGPKGMLKLMVGKFDTPYGAEVADSQLNVTYTRSMLNFYAQPFFHTGVRADLQVSEQLEVRAMVVNGWNNAVDNNFGKSVGLQVNVHPIEQLLLSLGWLGGPEQPDRYLDETSQTTLNRASMNKRWRHIVDAVADWTPNDRFRVLFNFDWATDEFHPPGTPEPERKVWWGTDLTLRSKIHDLAFVGLRGSYIRDRDGYLVATGRDTRVVSGTLTLGYTPTPNLVFKLEPRIDRANEADYLVGTGDTSRTQATIILGAVATTN